MPVNSLRKGIKREEVLFILRQASHCFGIAYGVLSFEGSQLGERLWLCRLLPNARQLGLDLSSFASRNSSKHVALFMDKTALARSGREQFDERRQQAIVSVGDDEVNLAGPAGAQIVQETEPSLLAFLRTGVQCQHLFVSFQIHTQSGQNDGGIGLLAVTNAEMDRRPA